MHLMLLGLLGPPLLLAALLALLLVVANLPENRRAVRLTRDFPQPNTRLANIPFIGHFLFVMKQKDDLFRLPRYLRKTLGSRYMIKVLITPTLNISDPEAVEAVLSNSRNIEKGMMYDFLKPWLGEGLLTSSGKLWHSRRKLLTPAFHFRILGQFSEHLEHQAEVLVEQLAEAQLEAVNAVNVMPLVSRATLRSIRVTAMGQVHFKDGSAQVEESYFQGIHRVGEAMVHRLIRPWLWPPLGFKLLSSIGFRFYKDLEALHDFTEKIIKQRKSQLLQGTSSFQNESGDGGSKKKKVQPFLDVLLSVQKEGFAISDRSIREEVDTFMFEGHDTTSMALCWALELLGRHPAEQEALAEEVRAAGSDWESVSKLPYLDRVMKECLRLRPSVPFIARFITEDIDLKNGQVIPRRAAVHVHIYDLHRHPDHFPEPERFDPDRFLPENEQTRHPFAYIPFSAGPRNCIGKKFAQMEVKLFLSAIVRRFVIRSTVSEMSEIIPDLVLRPKSGIFLKLTKRD